MKLCSDALARHLAGEVTSLATLWRLTRADGTVMGFTDHDRDLEYDGAAFKAATGFTPTSVASAAGMAVDNLDIQSVLDSADITEDDLLAGLYDHASVEILLVNHQDPGMGGLVLRKGRLGEVKSTGQGFVAELRGMTDAFARSIGQLYSPTCRADLGDGRCRVDLGALTVTGSVTAATSRREFADSARSEADGWFDLGLLRWSSGANAGAGMEVRAYRAGQFSLFLPMPREVAAGDTYSVARGCDRRFQTCRDTFDNVLNFQGEPHVPGLDYLVESAGR